MNISKIEYNWYYTNENGEDYFTHDLGKRGVTDIKIINIPDIPYHAEVYFENGSIQKIFNINKLYYKEV